MDINKFLGETDKESTQPSKWDEVIQPEASYLLTGDVGMGKSALAYFIMERYSEKYDLTPAVVGLPKSKRTLLPDSFRLLTDIREIPIIENAIVFIDEADIQLPLDSNKDKEAVINFLSLPRQRAQIFILAYHFPRLVKGTYLPFFSGFLFKRPPYLIEFASKKGSDELMQMMDKAGERFNEMPSEDEVKKNTYVVAPRIRWQGLLQNPLPTFWSNDLSKIWSGVGVVERRGERLVVSDQLKLSALLRRQDENEQSNTMQRLAKVSSLFSGGVPFEDIIEYDKHFNLEQLRQQCRDAGISISGDKKMLAAKLIARQRGKLVTCAEEAPPSEVAFLEHADEWGYLYGLTIVDPTAGMIKNREAIMEAIKDRYGDKIPNMLLDDMQVGYSDYQADIIFSSKIHWTSQKF